MICIFVTQIFLKSHHTDNYNSTSNNLLVDLYSKISPAKISGVCYTPRSIAVPVGDDRDKKSSRKGEDDSSFLCVTYQKISPGSIGCKPLANTIYVTTSDWSGIL
jgi:hypothetical protein